MLIKEKLYRLTKIYYILGILFLLSSCNIEASSPTLTLCIDGDKNGRCGSIDDIPLSNITVTIFAQDSTDYQALTDNNGQIPVTSAGWSLDLTQPQLQFLCLKTFAESGFGSTDVTFTRCGESDL
ncbi:MAG: hypothetical protein Fur0011_3010 [Candidatus Microgenomates bacterium]